MRVLLLQPEDSPRRGPWAAEPWDLVVDLGKSSSYAAAEWSELMHCSLLRADSFCENVNDIRRMGEVLKIGRGRLLDKEGIDWWHLRSLEILREASAILGLQRLAREIPRSSKLWSTRPSWTANALSLILQLPVRAYGEGLIERTKNRASRYARMSRYFPAAQIKEIVLDKYDPSFRWRARFSYAKKAANQPLVLIPSAYTNVSRVASAYAQMLPEQLFLLVATRRSATLFEARSNVRTIGLGAYANSDSSTEELSVILESWSALIKDLRRDPDLDLLYRLGMFDAFPAAFAQGLAVRNAWQRVFEQEPICGVLCGDDTNVNTLLPVLLARRRRLPTVDFHHGALDGFYLAKEPPCDLYLAKTELERDYLIGLCGLPAAKVVVGSSLPRHRYPADSNSHIVSPSGRARGCDSPKEQSIVLFSEPYEVAGARTEEVYRELLPALCALAGKTGRGIVLKLHPFESATERSGILESILGAEDRARITIVGEPLSENLLSQTWVGVTVESTTVLDCASRGIPCFLCEWLACAPFGYLQQFAKFGAGEILHSVKDVAEIPRRVAESAARANKTSSAGYLWKPVEPKLLARWLGAEVPELAARQR